MRNKEFKFDALHFNEKEWKFALDQMVVEGLNEDADGLQKDATALIEKDIHDFKDRFEKASNKQAPDAYLNTVKEFPMDTVIPMACIYFIVHFAEVYEIQDDKFIMMGFNLAHMNMLTTKQNKMLKQIK